MWWWGDREKEGNREKVYGGKSVSHSFPTLCNLMNCSSSGSSVHDILQARILEWVTMPFSRVSATSRDRICISHISSIGRQVLLPLAPPGKTNMVIIITHIL